MTTWDEVKKKCHRLYRCGVLFECGKGWAPIILDLSLKIEKILLQMAEDGDADTMAMYAIQVKEKYGTLRFYMSLQTEEMTDLIHEAEAASSQICENCADVGKMRNKRQWMHVSCDKCLKIQEGIHERGSPTNCY